MPDSQEVNKSHAEMLYEMAERTLSRVILVTTHLNIKLQRNPISLFATCTIATSTTATTTSIAATIITNYAHFTLGNPFALGIPLTPSKVFRLRSPFTLVTLFMPDAPFTLRFSLFNK
uniref:Uncharacterized protein n=1 Tax=Glossina pallidipes TaxID=7398 RepID=A0A1B0A588_GLOPL